MTSASPPLSITIATNFGWEAIRTPYESLRAQADAAGAEVILLDSSESTAPDGALGPLTRWISMPGADITEMRMRGYREAVGEIVAMTEDHCIPAPDWVEAMLLAHAEHPDAAAIGGVSRNGSTELTMDWASFYAGHAPFIAPLPAGPAAYISGVNLSYKRTALQEAITGQASRAVETLINEQLKAVGALLFADDRVSVTHIQSRGLLATPRLHFYAGRNFEGTRELEHSGDRHRRAMRAAIMPLPRTAKRIVTVLGRGEPASRVARATPALLAIFVAQAVGEVCGALLGPGQSAGKLH
jgi:hypothetical protein